MDSKLIASGKTLSITGTSLGLDRYGKFGLSMETMHAHMAALTGEPDCKVPWKSLYGIDGARHFVKISLGYSKNAETLRQTLKATKDKRITVDVVQQYFNDPKYGRGVYFTLISVPFIEAL